jgi:four helix bundle protein
MVRAMDTPPYNIQKRTFLFARRIVGFARQLSSAHPVTRKLAFELLKSATSVGANVEEADAGQTKPDFRTKIAIARKEAKEAVYWLRLLAATDSAIAHHVPPLLDEANQLASILTAIKKNADRGKDRR